MRKHTFEIGEVYGDYTIISSESKSKYGHTLVLVRCKCGKEEWKSLSDLKNNRIRSCRNCGARRRSRNINIGDVFKNWTVIKGPILKNQTILYEAKCKCGRIRLFTPAELMNPNKAFMCQKCAGIKRGQEASIKNGMFGKLTQSKFSKLERTAKARNINFCVTKEDLWNKFISQKQKCAITGEFIEDINKASLDRIDSSKPYVIDNIQWVTKQANLSKHIMSMNELIEFCKKVINHANQQPSQPLTKLEGSETNS